VAPPEFTTQFAHARTKVNDIANKQKKKRKTKREFTLYLLLCLSFNDNNNKIIKKRILEEGDFFNVLMS